MWCVVCGVWCVVCGVWWGTGAEVVVVLVLTLTLRPWECTPAMTPACNKLGARRLGSPTLGRLRQPAPALWQGGQKLPKIHALNVDSILNDLRNGSTSARNDGVAVWKLAGQSESELSYGISSTRAALTVMMVTSGSTRVCSKSELSLWTPARLQQRAPHSTTFPRHRGRARFPR